jgi:hypothetical protein
MVAPSGEIPHTGMIEPLPFYDHGMTDEQLKTIGIISLNWSIVERELTDILSNLDPRDSKIAVYNLDKKLKLLGGKLKGDPKPSHYKHADWSEVFKLYDDLKKSVEKFREGRNHIIHGTVIRFFGGVREPAIYSNKTRQTKVLSQLPKILNQSTYLTHVMAHLSSALYGSVLKMQLPSLDLPAFRFEP